MFRLHSSALPKDPVFPHDLKGLGYFINSDDEIRSIKDPKSYFKFFLTKNERYNVVQREGMNDAIRAIIGDRLQGLGLDILRLPLGAKPDEPHIPIYFSQDIYKHSRVIILFYEHNQDLGVFAHRIIGGQGGIDEGSAVNFVKYIQSQPCSKTNTQPPGIILANMGQLRWWRRGKKAVSQTTWYALPQKSAVHGAMRFDSIKNTVPGNRDTAEHVDYVINHVVGKLVAGTAEIDIIGVSDGAVKVVEFFNDPTNYGKWAHRLGAIALLAPFHHPDSVTNPNFASWLLSRGRAYVVAEEEANMPIATIKGRRGVPGFGCNTYSLGEPFYTEKLLPLGYKIVVDWFLEVANTPEYENPTIVMFDPDEKIVKEEVPDEQDVGWVNEHSSAHIGDDTT